MAIKNQSDQQVKSWRQQGTKNGEVYDRFILKQGTNVSRNKEGAFINYYNEHNIIPVTQIIDAGHVSKRHYLYTTLGVPSCAISKWDILEFGPGGGYNAVATSTFGPNKYTLVDASSASIDVLNKSKKDGLFKGVKELEIVESTILNFKKKDIYDLVIIEGLVPGQCSPNEILKHAANYTKKGGILISTCISATSIFSETCRRLFRPYIKANAKDFNEQCKLGAKIFGPQLDALSKNHRPAIDWVQDNIMHPHSPEDKIVYTIEDTINLLNDDFIFYSSSPKFAQDDRFYKKVDPSNWGINDLAIDECKEYGTGMIDYRIPIKLARIVGAKQTKEIEKKCLEAWNMQLEIVNTLSYSKLSNFVEIALDIEASLPIEFNATKASIQEFCSEFALFVKGEADGKFEKFKNWWGRGQQYISMMRK